jgi:hypothetical protein
MRRAHRLFFLLLSACAAIPLTGCYVETRTVTAEDEAVYEDEPPPPPPPLVEVEPASPGPEFVWIAGYHHWDGRHYVWVRGRYERRPHMHARWVQPHWEVRGRVHVWVRGRWE